MSDGLEYSCRETYVLEIRGLCPTRVPTKAPHFEGFVEYL